MKNHTPSTYKYRLKFKKFKTCHLFYVSCFKILYYCLLKFVGHKMNSKMVKSGIVVLTRRQMVDMTDADVDVGWML
jgi:hypothetical protein